MRDVYKYTDKYLKDDTLKTNIYHEYGGYLPLELSHFNGEYYDGNSKKIWKLNSGRAAIYEAINDMGLNCVWIPTYLCSSVENFLCKRKIEIKYYNIDYEFFPINIKQNFKEAVLWTNWYGTVKEEVLLKVINSFDNLILDNTQDFYRQPVSGAYNVYSPRKFFGVSDGAYLISDKFQEECILDESRTSTTSQYLINVLGTSTNETYNEFLINESRIDNEGVMRMSQITSKILSSINYEEIKRQRIENFYALDDMFQDINEINDLEEACKYSVPMVYPLLIRSNNLRKALIDNRVYVSQWWKDVLKKKSSNSWERYLAEYLFPLPIDQRYSVDDMKAISKIVLNNIGE